MVQLALQEDAYLEACNAYQEVWDTEEVKKDEGRELHVRLHVTTFEMQLTLTVGPREHHDLCGARTI